MTPTDPRKKANSTATPSSNASTTNVMRSPPMAPEPFEVGHKDFIIISEFSELSGPDCLMVIPKGSDEGFDTNSYVMRIMSVDQNKGFDSSNIPQDTQSVIMHGKSSCYVHYFTLYDIFARGYVRPVCMSYITSEKDKIMENFEDLYESFMKVSNVIKNANMEGFEDDLLKRIKDLEVKYAEFGTTEDVEETEPLEAFQEPGGDFDHSGVGLTPSMIRQYLEEMRSMLRRINEFRVKNNLTRRPKSETRSETLSNQNDSRIVGDSSGFEDDSAQSLEHPSSDVMAYLSKKHGRYEEKELRTFENLSNGSFPTAFHMFKKILQKFRANRLILAIEKEEESQLRFVPSLLSFGGFATLNFDSNIYRNKGELKEIVLTRVPYDSPAEPIPQPRQSFVHGASENSDHTSHSPPSISSSEKSSPTLYVDAHDRFDTEGEGDSEDESKIYQVHSICHNSASGTSESQRALFEKWKGMHGKSVKIFARSLWADGEHSLKEFNALQTIRETPALSKPILFSLLRGRPVFIQGTNESEILEYVEAFSLFVPGFRTSNTIVPLYHMSEKQDRVKQEKTTVRFVDLVTKGLKLVGITKKTTISPAVLPYISLYDLDTKTLDAPQYKGELLDQIITAGKTWTSDETFKAHVHQALLYISMKVFLYYHLPLLVSQNQQAPSQLITASIPSSTDTTSQLTELTLPATPEHAKTPPGSHHPVARPSTTTLSPSDTLDSSMRSNDTPESKKRNKGMKDVCWSLMKFTHIIIYLISKAIIFGQ
eukprot:TRINITY_DN4749_c0_g1_i1.p1 TRINITY_DN4749_c0_g1~~TRINITY_DN4749_c0_g1_i1.p1  ORF type:complete len:766 (-),score=136.95 TRINITY_DN4749_c0_g1_i1:62-2359(-)